MADLRKLPAAPIKSNAAQPNPLPPQFETLQSSTFETEDRLDRGCCLRPCAGCTSAKDLQTLWDSCCHPCRLQVPIHSNTNAYTTRWCCETKARMVRGDRKPMLHGFSRSASLGCQGNRSLVYRLNWWARHLHVHLRRLLQLLQGVFPAQNSMMDQPSGQHHEQPHRD